MKQMTPAAVERAMKLQDVMLRAMARRITWYQAAEMLGSVGGRCGNWLKRGEKSAYRCRSRRFDPEGKNWKPVVGVRVSREACASAETS